MTMKRNILLLAAITTFCGTSARAIDYSNIKPIQIGIPKLPIPLPSGISTGIYRPELDLNKLGYSINSRVFERTKKTIGGSFGISL